MCSIFVTIFIFSLKFAETSKIFLCNVLSTDHIKYAGMFLETSYFDNIYDVDINNLAGYEERTRVLYMIHPWKGNPLDAKVPYGQNFAI